jgi:hypothetical protein
MYVACYSQFIDDWRMHRFLVGAKQVGANGVILLNLYDGLALGMSHGHGHEVEG